MSFIVIEGLLSVHVLLIINFMHIIKYIFHVQSNIISLRLSLSQEGNIKVPKIQLHINFDIFVFSY